jgi:hypothetical protein
MWVFKSVLTDAGKDMTNWKAVNELVPGLKEEVEDDEPVSKTA